MYKFSRRICGPFTFWCSLCLSLGDKKTCPRLYNVWSRLLRLFNLGANDACVENLPSGSTFSCDDLHSCGQNGNNWGTELRHLISGSSCACGAICNSDPQCAAWTYNNNNQNDCTLRSSFGDYIDNCGGACRSAPKGSSSFFVNLEGCNTNGDCVASGNYPSAYGNSESCELTIVQDAELVPGSVFDLEMYSDDLIIAGTSVYYKSSIPNSLAPGDVISWSSDHSVVKDGWQICFQTPIPPPVSEFFTYSSGCNVVDDCVSSGNYPSSYGGDESCSVSVSKFSYLIPGDLFELETCCDDLIIEGVDVTSTSQIPDTMTSGQTIQWSSDGSVGYEGWQICFSDTNPVTPPAVSEFFTYSSGCNVVDDCVSSGNYPSDYGGGESCSVSVSKFSYLIPGDLFELETCCDDLIIEGVDVTSTSQIPDTMTSGQTIQWSSDGSVGHEGWQICFSSTNPLSTESPTNHPSFEPSLNPSMVPTLCPTHGPTNHPSFNPSMVPSAVPTLCPTHGPTNYPSFEPSANPIPPSVAPTLYPTQEPSIPPTQTVTEYDPCVDILAGQTVDWWITTIQDNLAHSRNFYHGLPLTWWYGKSAEETVARLRRCKCSWSSWGVVGTDPENTWTPCIDAPSDCSWFNVADQTNGQAGWTSQSVAAENCYLWPKCAGYFQHSNGMYLGFDEISIKYLQRASFSVGAYYLDCPKTNQVASVGFIVDRSGSVNADSSDNAYITLINNIGEEFTIPYVLSSYGRHDMEVNYEGEAQVLKIEKPGGDGLYVSSAYVNEVQLALSGFWLDDPCQAHSDYPPVNWCDGVSKSFPINYDRHNNVCCDYDNHGFKRDCATLGSGSSCTLGATWLVECAQECNRQPWCMSFTYDPNARPGTCHLESFCVNPNLQCSGIYRYMKHVKGPMYRDYDFGYQSCSDDTSNPLEDPDECSFYASTKGYTWGGQGSWPSNPSGCIRYFDGSNTVYWNTITGGPASPGYTQVCWIDAKGSCYLDSNDFMPVSLLRTCLASLGGGGVNEIQYIELGDGSNNNYLDEVCAAIDPQYHLDVDRTISQSDNCFGGSAFMYPGPCAKGWLGGDCSRDCSNYANYVGFYCKVTPAPTLFPSSSPSFHPSCEPTGHPSTNPTHSPSYNPSYSPSQEPTLFPTCEPTFFPSASPSFSPTKDPSYCPTFTPTYLPSLQPSQCPSNVPTYFPSEEPSLGPTTSEPSVYPSTRPSTIPSTQPSTSPSTFPSTRPSFGPQHEIKPYCPEILFPNGKVMFPETIAGEWAYANCTWGDGYVNETLDRICDHHGDWVGPPVLCTDRTCAAEDDWPETSVLSVAYYLCSSGLGVHSRYCDLNETFGLPENNCEEVYCGVSLLISEDVQPMISDASYEYFPRKAVPYNAAFVCNLTENDTRTASVVEDFKDEYMMVLTVEPHIALQNFEESCSAQYAPVRCELLSSSEVLLHGSESDLIDLQETCLLDQFCPLCERARDCNGHGDPLPGLLSSGCTCECDEKYEGQDCSVLMQRPDDFVDPPEMMFANFSNTGLSLSITFNVATDKAGYSGVFYCSELFSRAFVESFGMIVDGVETSSCFWTSVQELTIGLGRSPSIIPGDLVTILPKIKVYEGNSFTTFGSIEVHAMKEISPPVAVISGPTRIDLCATLQLSGTMSYGGLGRSMQFIWDVAEVDGRCMGVASSQPEFSLDPKCFLSEDPDHIYVVSLVVTNWLGKTHTATHAFKRLFSPTHHVSILGGTVKRFYASDRISVGVELQATTCDENGLGEFHYVWSPLSRHETETEFNITITEDFNTHDVRIPNKKELEILPMSLSYSMHAFRVTVHANGVENFAHVLLHIERPPPKAKAAVEITIWTKEELVIHADSLAEFYLGPNEEITNVFELQWRYDSGEKFYNDRGVASLTIPPSTFNQRDQPYEIQLFAGNHSFSTYVRAIAVEIPELVLRSNLDFVFNPYEVNLLEAQLIPSDDPRPWTFNWSFPTLNVKYPDPRIYEFNPTPTSALLKIASTLDPGALITVQVAASTPSIEGSIVASLTFQTNSPPSGGYCEISPRLGTALADVFQIKCRNWGDEHAPLMYSFALDDAYEMRTGFPHCGDYIEIESESLASAKCASDSKCKSFGYNNVTQNATFCEVADPDISPTRDWMYSIKNQIMGRSIIIQGFAATDSLAMTFPAGAYKLTTFVRDSLGMVTEYDVMFGALPASSEQLDSYFGSASDDLTSITNSADPSGLAKVAVTMTKTLNNQGDALNMSETAGAMRTMLLDSLGGIDGQTDSETPEQMQQMVDVLGKVFDNPDQVDPISASNGASLAHTMLIKATESSEAALSTGFANTMLNGVSGISKSTKEESGFDVADSVLTTIDGVALGLLKQNLPGEDGFVIESDGIVLRSSKQTSDGVTSENCGGGQMEFPDSLGESLGDQVGGTVDCAFSVQDDSVFLNKPASNVISLGFFDGASKSSRRHLLKERFTTGACSPIEFAMENNPFQSLIAENETEEVTMAQCTYYDTASGNWSSEGCVAIDANTTQTRCACSHLTSFGINSKSFIPQMNMITLEDLRSVSWDLLTQYPLAWSITLALHVFFLYMMAYSAFVDDLPLLSHTEVWDIDSRKGLFENSKFGKIYNLHRAEMSPCRRWMRRFWIELKNNHPLFVNCRDGCSNETGEERWMLLLNAIVTSFAVSAIFFGREGTTMVQQYMAVVFTTIFGSLQPMLVGHLLTKAEPRKFELNEEMKKATTRARVRSIVSFGINNAKTQRRNSRVNLAALNLDEVKEHTVELPHRKVLQVAREYFFAFGGTGFLFPSNQHNFLNQWFAKCIHSDEELDLVSIIDRSGDSTIQYDEFQVWFTEMHHFYGEFWTEKGQDLIANAKSIFNMFDLVAVDGKLMGEEKNMLFEAIYPILYPEDKKLHYDPEEKARRREQFFEENDAQDGNIDEKFFVRWFVTHLEDNYQHAMMLNDRKALDDHIEHFDAKKPDVDVLISILDPDKTLEISMQSFAQFCKRLKMKRASQNFDRLSEGKSSITHEEFVSWIHDEYIETLVAKAKKTKEWKKASRKKFTISSMKGLRVNEDFYRESKILAHLPVEEEVVLSEQRGARGHIKEPLVGWIDLYLEDGQPTIVGDGYELPESPRMMKETFDKISHAAFVEDVIRQRWIKLKESVKLGTAWGTNYSQIMEVATRQGRDIQEVVDVKRADDLFDELNLIHDLKSGKNKKVSYKVVFTDTFNLQLRPYKEKKDTGAVVMDPFGHRKVKIGSRLLKINRVNVKKMKFRKIKRTLRQATFPCTVTFRHSNDHQPAHSIELVQLNKTAAGEPGEMRSGRYAISANSGVGVRESRAPSSQFVTRLSKGVVVEVVEVAGDSVRIISPKSGWISARIAQLISADSNRNVIKFSDSEGVEDTAGAKRKPEIQSIYATDDCEDPLQIVYPLTFPLAASKKEDYDRRISTFSNFSEFDEDVGDLITVYHPKDGGEIGEMPESDTEFSEHSSIYIPPNTAIPTILDDNNSDRTKRDPAASRNDSGRSPGDAKRDPAALTAEEGSYVMGGEYLGESSDSEQENDEVEFVVIRDEGIPCYSSPNPTTEIISEFSKGTRIVLDSSDSNWIHIIFPVEGWVENNSKSVRLLWTTEALSELEALQNKYEDDWDLISASILGTTPELCEEKFKELDVDINQDSNGVIVDLDLEILALERARGALHGDHRIIDSRWEDTGEILVSERERKWLQYEQDRIFKRHYTLPSRVRKIAMVIMVIWVILCDLFIVVISCNFDIEDQPELTDDVALSFEEAALKCAGDPFKALDISFKIQYDAQQLEILSWNPLPEFSIFPEAKNDSEEWFYSALTPLLIAWLLNIPLAFAWSTFKEVCLFPPDTGKIVREEEPKEFVETRMDEGRPVNFTEYELILEPHFVVNCRREFYTLKGLDGDEDIGDELEEIEEAPDRKEELADYIYESVCGMCGCAEE